MLDMYSFELICVRQKCLQVLITNLKTVVKCNRVGFKSDLKNLLKYLFYLFIFLHNFEGQFELTLIQYEKLVFLIILQPCF